MRLSLSCHAYRVHTNNRIFHGFQARLRLPEVWIAICPDDGCIVLATHRRHQRTRNCGTQRSRSGDYSRRLRRERDRRIIDISFLYDYPRQRDRGTRVYVSIAPPNAQQTIVDAWEVSLGEQCAAHKASKSESRLEQTGVKRGGNRVRGDFSQKEIQISRFQVKEEIVAGA